jgi:hypothetical protein
VVEKRNGILYPASPVRRVKMTTFISNLKRYLEVSQWFHWATKEHYVMWFTGSTERHRRTEVVLPRLVKKYENPKTRNRSLYATKYGKRLIYICPRKKRKGDILYKIDHGLGCTECMVRFYRANTTSKIIEERKFFGCGSIPDFGIQYSKATLLVEYSSRDNFYQHNVIKNKLSAYRHNLWKIEERFKTNGIIIFVIDIPRERLERFIGEMKPIDLPVFFVDFESFKSVDLGKQLSAEIYYFGGDGSIGPLTDNAKS